MVLLRASSSRAAFAGMRSNCPPKRKPLARRCRLNFDVLSRATSFGGERLTQGFIRVPFIISDSVALGFGGP
jgi:hypothetical protein